MHSSLLVQPLPRSLAPKEVAEVIAGGIGGGFQGLVLSPTLLLKTRVMTDPVFRTSMSLSETCGKSASVGLGVIRNEGLQALMKGSVVFSAKRVADWSTRFVFSIAAENLLFEDAAELSVQQRVVASLAGGTVSALSFE